MNVTALKKIRVAVSFIFFMLTLSLFLDYRNIFPSTIYSIILFLQFIPSFIKFLSLAGIGAVGFIAVLLLTLFSGRVYCSSICPLGTFQDVISYLSRKLKKKKKKREFLRYEKGKSWWRYSFLALAIIPFFGGTIFFVNLLDPYSSFGKMSAHLFRHLLIAANNSIAFLLEKMNLYIVYPFEFKGVDIFSFSLAVTIFLVVAYLSFTKGRMYCNTVCPVGTLLGLVSKFAFIKIAIDESKCKACGICERVCKSNCIDKVNKTVEFDRCVACFNCFDVCPTDGMKFEYGFTSIKNVKQKTETTLSSELSQHDEGVIHSKRNFLFNTFVYVVGLTGISLSQIKIIPKKASKVAIFRKNPVTPPGSKSRINFAQNCTSCHLCVSVCPTQVLQPAYLEYGLLGMFQPRMDYQTGFCNFECKLCGEVCPTGAISKSSLPEKKLTQLGKVKFVKDNCIVNTENTDCGACSEHCPTKAVNMVPYKNKLVIPEVKDEFCIGCGACEFACPTKPYKAIYVEGNPTHLTAKINKEKRIEQKVDYKEEFPF